MNIEFSYSSTTERIGSTSCTVTSDRDMGQAIKRATDMALFLLTQEGEGVQIAITRYCSECAGSGTVAASLKSRVGFRKKLCPMCKAKPEGTDTEIAKWIIRKQDLREMHVDVVEYQAMCPAARHYMQKYNLTPDQARAFAKLPDRQATDRNIDDWRYMHDDVRPSSDVVQWVVRYVLANNGDLPSAAAIAATAREVETREAARETPE